MTTGESRCRTLGCIWLHNHLGGHSFNPPVPDTACESYCGLCRYEGLMCYRIRDSQGHFLKRAEPTTAVSDRKTILQKYADRVIGYDEMNAQLANLTNRELLSLAARSQLFNDTTGSMTWKHRTAAEHPDRCVCQNETTPHKHRKDLSCARCTTCTGYTPALSPPAPPDDALTDDDVALIDFTAASVLERSEIPGGRTAHVSIRDLCSELRGARSALLSASRRVADLTRDFAQAENSRRTNADLLDRTYQEKAALSARLSSLLALVEALPRRRRGDGPFDGPATLIELPAVRAILTEP